MGWFDDHLHEFQDKSDRYSDPDVVDGAKDESVKTLRQIAPRKGSRFGIFAYRNLLELLADPHHPNHDETIAWVGEDFDPAYFDPEDVNAVLARLPPPVTRRTRGRPVGVWAYRRVGVSACRRYRG